jgi:hypothetical protein
MDLLDLYAIHEDLAKHNCLSVHPSRWLYSGRRLGYDVFDMFAGVDEAVRVGSQMITHYKGLRNAGLDSKIRHKHGHYLATSTVAERYRRSAAKRVDRECAVRDLLATQEPEAMIEVRTPVGKIDLLLPDAVIEVKNVVGWKVALGQVLAYGVHHRGKAKVLHLFGRIDHPDLKDQVQVCREFGVLIRYQRVRKDADGFLKLDAVQAYD